MTGKPLPKVLFVDDEQENLDALKRLFRKTYDCHFARGGVDALTALASTPGIAAIVSDQRMPQMTGVEFFEKSLRIQPEATRILVTGYTDIEAVIQAINEGRVYEYVSKPWDPEPFKLLLARAVDRYHLQKELAQKNEALARALHELSRLDETKTRFLTLLSHELRTPLTALAGHLELLETQSPPTEESVKQRLARLREAYQRLQHLVDDALLFATAQMQHLPGSTPGLNPGLNAIHPLDRAFLQSLISRAKERRPEQQHVNVTLTLPKQTPTLTELVKSTLAIVLTKTLDNAVKYARTEAQLSAYVSAEQLILIVSDDGPGIPPPVADALFRTFAEPTDLLHHREGLGLGLKTASLFLQEIQGRISFIQNRSELPSSPNEAVVPALLTGASLVISVPIG